MNGLKYKEKLLNDIMDKYKENIEPPKNPKAYIPGKYLNLMHKEKYTNKYGNCIRYLSLVKKVSTYKMRWRIMSYIFMR